MGIYLHNCIVCPLCILLERTSAGPQEIAAGEEVEQMHELKTQKSIIDRPECCGCVTVIVQDGRNLFMGSTS